MNRKLFMGCWVLGAVILAACGGSDDPDPEPIPEVKATLTLADSGLETVGLSFTSDADPTGKSILFETNAAWTARSNADWCVVSPTSGGAGNVSVKVTTAANTNYDERKAVVTLKAGETVSKSITVLQKQKDALLVTTNKYEDLVATESNIQVEVKSNIQYTIRVTEGEEWITEMQNRALSTYHHNFAIAANPTTAPRTGKIVVQSGELSETITVTQVGSSEVLPTEPVQLDYGPLYAFPGAEGCGKNTVGGRGGTVLHVTSLEDDGSEGTLRWAVTQKKPRVIVFDVAGTIHLKSQLKTTADYLTIAGQTSPGGICIADYPFVINSNQVILRFLRFRPGDASGDEPDGLGGMDKSDVIVDHCSVSWSVDECLSVYGMTRSTVQWCIASQALRVSTHGKGTHGYGGNWGGNQASYHHNLIAHCESRVPRLGPRSTTQLNEYVDIRNNVFYNWAGEGCYGGENQNVNLVNNYYKPGPATQKATARTRYRIAKIGVRTEEYVTKYTAFEPSRHKWGTFYITGNKVEGNEEVTHDNWTKGVYEQQDNDAKVDYLWNEETMKAIRKEAEVMDPAGVTTHTADEAYAKVLQYVGACNYRDAVDRLILDDVKEGKASCTAAGNKEGYINTPADILNALPELGTNPYPELKRDISVDVTDTDGDGVPDSWERAHGLDPKDVTDGTAKTIDVHGAYTNLEMYLNSLVKDFMF